MNRLPKPGQDAGNWGTILNGFLNVEHAADGTLKIRADGTLTPARLGALSKTSNLSDIADNASARSNLGLGSSAVRNVGTTNDTVAAGDDSRITSAVRLGGDLGGTATTPLVTKLQGTPINLGTPADGQSLVYSNTAKAWVLGIATSQASSGSTSSAVQLGGDIGGTTAVPIVTSTHLASPLSIAQGGTGSATQNFVDTASTQTIAGDKTFTDTITASALRLNGGSPATGKVLTSDANGNAAWADPAIVSSSLAADTDVTIASPSNGQSLLYDAATNKWTNQPLPVATDATGSATGLVQLAGDLSGAAGNPTVVSTHLSAPLPITQGGTGANAQNFVDLTTAQTIGGIKTFSDDVIVSGTIQAGNLSGINTGDQDLSSLVPKTTAINGHALSGNISLNADDVLPTQTGNAGKFLASDGTNTSWAIAPTFTSPLTAKGDLYTYDSADTRLGVGTDSQVLTADSTRPTGLAWNSLAPIATTGAYTDLTGAPTLGSASAQNVTYFLQASNNLSDVASASTARINLGLGVLSTLNSINLTANVGSTVLPIANGGTGSAAQNFVDLSSTQNSIAGNKTFTAGTTISPTGAGVTALTLNGTGTGSAAYTALSVNGSAAGYRTQFLVQNTGASGTSNTATFALQANTSSATRAIMQVDASFNNVTDATRNSLITISGASAGTYGTFLQFNGTAATVYGPFAPNANNSYNLGASSYYWQYIYGSRMYLNSTAYLDGGTSGAIKATTAASSGFTDSGATSGTSDYNGFYLSTSDSGTYNGALFGLKVSPTGAATTKWVIGAKFNPIFNSTTGLTKLSAFYAVPEAQTGFTSGTIASMYGFESQPYVDTSGGTISTLTHIQLDSLGGSGAPTITTMCGISMSNPGKSVGTLYGIYLNSLTSGSTNYAIYTNSGTVHFGDNTELASGKNLALAAGNIVTDTTTGTIIGTSASQKLGFYGATPTVQPSTVGTTTGYTIGTSTPVTIDGKFTGNTGTTAYTIGDVVNALKKLGLIAA